MCTLIGLLFMLWPFHQLEHFVFADYLGVTNEKSYRVEMLTGTETLTSTITIRVDTVDPNAAVRGQFVTLSGIFPSNSENIIVELNSIDSTTSPAKQEVDILNPKLSVKNAAQMPVIVKEAGKTVGFLVPTQMKLGKYDIVVRYTNGDKDKNNDIVVNVPRSESEFRITTTTPIRVEAIYPAVSYVKDDVFEFMVIGEGFSPYKEDNTLYIEGQGASLTCTDVISTTDCLQQEVIDNGRKLKFYNIPSSTYSGPLRVRIRVGDRYSEEFTPVTLSTRGRTLPVIGAILIVVISLVITRAMLVAGHLTIGDLFIDRETQTLSLSRIQFIVWTVAAIFGYSYLATSQMLVQGKLIFPDVPDNLPGIILISASTSAVALGLTSVKGSKGAGEKGWSWADLLTTGGVFAPERLQFVLWTFIGILLFVGLTLSVAPGNITSLPTIPLSFLYLMGISSFGYLGGKLARKPGPNIAQVTGKTGEPTIEIIGTNLSPEAEIISVTTGVNSDMPVNLASFAIIIAIDPPVTSTGSPEFAEKLKVTFNVPTDRNKYVTSASVLTITNPDKQKATAELEKIKVIP